MKMNHKIWLCLLLLAALMMTACSSGGAPEAATTAPTEAAAGTQEEGAQDADAGIPETDAQYFSFDSLDDGTLSLRSYFGGEEELRIPASVGGVAVTRIGVSAFSGNETLREVVIPEGVQVIGGGAFSFCQSLESVVLPNSLTQIGPEAFSYCGALKTISLPERVTQIGLNAFRHCISLHSANLPSGLTALPSGLFAECEALRIIELPETLTTIAGEAFRGAGLLYVALPDQVDTVEDGAFLDCQNLKVVFLADRMAFSTLAVFPASTILAVTPGSDTEKYFQGRSVATEPKSHFPLLDGFLCHIADTLQLLGYVGHDEVVTFPESVEGVALTEVPERLFAGNQSMRELILPGTVQTVGRQACDGCTALESVQLPGVTELAEGSFQGCAALRSAVAPSLRRIGDSAFQGCALLTELPTAPELKEIASYAFASCEALESLTLPESLQTIGDHAFEGCLSLESLEIPQQVIAIGDSAFYGCSRLLLVTLPPAIEQIGQKAFSACAARAICVVERNSITDSALPSDVDRAYLPIKIFHDGLYTLGEEDAVYVRYLGSGEASTFIRPDIMGYDVTRVRNRAFAGCQSLEVEIPGSIQEIGAQAFVGSSDITVMTDQSGVVTEYCQRYKIDCVLHE